MATSLCVLPQFDSAVGSKHAAAKTYPKRTVQQYQVAPYFKNEGTPVKMSVNCKYSEFLSKRKRVIFIPVVKPIKAPFEKKSTFQYLCKFFQFLFSCFERDVPFVVKIYSFLEKKSAFCFHSTKLGNIKGKAATYFTFQRIWINVIQQFFQWCKYFLLTSL